MPKYVDGVELTQEGMHAIFARMGHPEIKSGTIYNGVPTIDKEALDKQSFMPVLTEVGPKRDSGHWIMLIKGPGNQYYLFDPMGKTSGESYQDILATQLPEGSTLSVIPNALELNKGLYGYWVASVGLKACAELNMDNPPNLETLGQITTDAMKEELNDNGYPKITGWLRAVSDKFPAGEPQPDAKALRKATEKDLHIETPSSIPPGKDTTPKEIPPKTTAPQVVPKYPLDSMLLESDDDVLETINYVHKEYLGKPYPGPLKNPKAPEEGRLPPNEGPDRGTHGLAHTVRTMACAEVMIEEARKAQLRGETLGKAKNGQTLADVTPEEMKKILIAQAFFVVGRDDERSGYDDVHKRNFYAEYHKKSEQAFRKYVEDNQLIGKTFKDQEEVDFYAAIILDKNHEWDATPAHILINQGHMVDLMRVKAPAEVALERNYDTLKGSVGPKGAEVVLKAHRDFLFATGAVVPSVNPEAINAPSRGGPYENPYNGEKFVIVDGQEPKSKKDLPKPVNRDYKLKNNERFLTIKEYYAFPDVQQTYPGYKTRLEGSSYSLPTPFAGECEQDPAKCLGAIQKARSKLQTDAIKNGFQLSTEKGRREPNVDEVAAAGIIQEILANPGSIQNDHVFINGQKLEEQFFRDLLAKCDMAIVGSLLNDQDISNIDKLMEHEKNTEFHETGEEPVSRRAIGKEWLENYRIDWQNQRKTPAHSIKMALIHMMQDGSWYYRRLNAVAQGRDTGSSFKEVLISALMVPSTFKALTDIQEPEFGKELSQTHPTKIHKGLMSLPPDITQKILNQSEAIIANTTIGLFSDPSAQTYQQMKINQLSHLLARTCASTSIDVKAGTFFTNGVDNENNIRLDIEDPHGLLNAKRVGGIGAGGENEYSVYLPDDVALIPTVVNKGNPNVISLVAVKSPDFMPRHESGYAVEPFMRMQPAKLDEIIESVEQEALSESRVHELATVFQFQMAMKKKAQLPDKGLVGRIARHMGNPQPTAYQNFLSQNVNPVIDKCFAALVKNDYAQLEQILSEFPGDEQWAAFISPEAKQDREHMNVIKRVIGEGRVMLHRQILPALEQCKDALERKDLPAALQALHSLPSDEDMSKVSIRPDLKEQIIRMKQIGEKILDKLIPPSASTPMIDNDERVESGQNPLLAAITQQIVALETEPCKDLDELEIHLATVEACLDTVEFLKSEHIKQHRSSEEPLDVSKLEELGNRLQKIKEKDENTLSAYSKEKSQITQTATQSVQPLPQTGNNTNLTKRTIKSDYDVDSEHKVTKVAEARPGFKQK
ncbi:Dot/Icm substrate protein [Legionella pneumophila]|uniref:SdeC protein, substrate of the Dot/Icm system n=1 Tax=Legionella pneumophila subsp. pneumophila TaxID=91891 RepID=A0AAV2UYZ4_LEGPN|nr:SdeC protein, substrate of the Dot/Icm system [Legionella pneumophila subsp. pneumophila]CZG20361.1 Dot/Icm substrate protein [Legionella pneumophila]CZG99035.1 Dot/Icm substrate protein [Legionella pneumophila]CZH59134.1 Dot/Icm substrate protein [Legionella pneumophila]CZH89609.1 Dot/Icm substrate protein [Legionella pneumophila]